MIRACSHNGQTNGDIHCLVPTKKLDGNKPLIVVHSHHQVPLARRCRNEHRIARKWTLGINTNAPRGFNCRTNDPALFVTKHAILACMRVESTHCNPRLGNAQLLAELMTKIDWVVDLPKCQHITHIHQWQVCSSKRHTQSRRTEHHGVSL